ncbi:MAG: toll/interleukin-1 receptor domain-containing protein [Candidatus Thiodiazotropha sp. (ex Codakia rugifera)]|nr:toll/interleukin-1 receptor domain-containing protein [Candidatus Thiodiazotropha sp. (ex Codakia rugifera)]
MKTEKTLNTILIEGETILRIPQPGLRQTRWKNWVNNILEIVNEHPELKLNRLSCSYKTLNADLVILRNIVKDIKDRESELTNTTEPPKTSQTHQESLKAGNGSINVFISYKNQDTTLAQTIKDQLTALNFDRVNVFLAYDDIRAGEKWKEQLFEKLRQSDWLIMIHTDPDYDWEWPNREAVMFETMHMNSNGGDRRLCCLHVTDRYPKTLNEFQHYKVAPVEGERPKADLSKADIEALYKKSRVYQFLKNFIAYPADNPIISDQSLAQPHLIKASKEIILGFMDAQTDKVVDQCYYPPRIEIVLPPDSSKAKLSISDKTTISLGEQSRRIFRYANSSFTWNQFKKDRISEASNKGQPSWLQELEDRINIGAQDREPDPGFGVLYTEHLKRFMRPILTRQEIFASNKRKFYVLLIEQPPTDFSGHREMGKLLAVLIFGSRFRFDYLIPLFRDITNIDEVAQYVDFTHEKMDMITTIESEAEQHGLTNPEDVVPIFNKSAQKEIRRLFYKWFEIRTKLWAIFDNPPMNSMELDHHRDQIIDIHRILYKMNTSFLTHSIKRYSELLNTELNYDETLTKDPVNSNILHKKKATRKKTKVGARKTNKSTNRKTSKKVSKKMTMTRK